MRAKGGVRGEVRLRARTLVYIDRPNFPAPGILLALELHAGVFAPNAEPECVCAWISHGNAGERKQ